MYVPHMEVLGINASLLSFSCYLALVLAGALLYLGALGPRFNIPKWSSGNGVESRLFFEKVAQVSTEQWQAYWRKDPVTIELDMTNDLVFESRLIAEKARFKAELMSIGSLLFKLAIPWLAPLSVSLFSSRMVWFWITILVAYSVVMVDFFIEDWREPSGRSQRRAKLWAMLAATLVTFAMIIAYVWV